MRRSIVGWLLLGVCLAGCSQQPESGEASTEPQQQAAAPEPEVTLEIKSWDETQQLVAEKKGKVVVLDIWSTSCVPCMREFPNLVELSHRFPDDVACISVNINYYGVDSEPPESFREEVMEFLTKRKATIDNILSSDEDEALLKRLGRASIPIVMVYDQNGEQHKVFEEAFTYEEDVVPLVEELLKAD